jgi:hypothetical protein
MKLTRPFVAAAALLAFASCQKTPGTTQLDREKVDFSTSIGDYSTRAADNHWDAGDLVGVYMIPAGGTLDANALAQNKKYTTTGTNALAPASTADEIYYPDNGAAVDFIAYYPWQTTITGFVYPVNVATQSPMTAIDLLYSDNAKGYTKGDPTADMTFTHELSKIILNIVDKTEAITMPAVTIEGINTTASFSLAAGELSGAGNPADVAMVVSSTGDHNARAEAIIIPGAAADYIFVFKIGEKTLRLVIEDLTPEAGKKYTYTVNVTDKVLVDGDGEIIDWNEEPGGDLEFDIKDMEDIDAPWDGDMSSVEVAAYPDEGGESMPLVPGLGFDPRYDYHTFWEGAHAVWNCEEDDDDILHLNFAEQLAAQFPDAVDPTVLYEITWLLDEEGYEADVNQPTLSANSGNVTIDRNNTDASKDNAGTYIILRATFNAANVDVPIIYFYCIEIRDIPAVEPPLPTGLLYFASDGTLSIGLWGEQLNPGNYREQLAFFQFGSVVGMIADGRQTGTSFVHSRDVKFNPIGETFPTWTNIPRFNTDDYAAGVRNVSVAEYHNGANVLAGRGDPCRLVGFKGADFEGKTPAEVDAMLANEAGWRLPTGRENAMFVDPSQDWWTGRIEEGELPLITPGENYTVANRFEGTGDNPSVGRFLQGAYPDMLLPFAGNRDNFVGSIWGQGGVSSSDNTLFWSSTPTKFDSTMAHTIRLTANNATMGNYSEIARGNPVRCVRM